MVHKYLGSVVPHTDNFFAALNSGLFSDGSFAFIPPGIRCPLELSTHFRINVANTGQFERTRIVAEKGNYVSYLEGCTARWRDENQLHAAVVDLVALENAEIKYSTVQNWATRCTKRHIYHRGLVDDQQIAIEWATDGLCLDPDALGDLFQRGRASYRSSIADVTVVGRFRGLRLR